MRAYTASQEAATIPSAHRLQVTVLGVTYLHMQLEDGSDLYLTEYGIPFVDQLLPKNHWADDKWFDEHSDKLPGTSTLYRIRTKKVRGVSKDIVLKWNRMGQDIPGGTEGSDLATAEFNSPFEEFSLLCELRDPDRQTPGQVYTHKPLAIYVPNKYVPAERLGRKRHRIEAMQGNHKGITLDLNRQYAVVYEWVKGIDLSEAFTNGMVGEDLANDLIMRADQDMSRKGFLVRDNKPHHIIVRPTYKGGLAKDKDNNILYAMIDFELLDRIPEREKAIRESKRKNYLVRQVHRFETREQVPPGMTPVNIMGVDYIFGHVESTGGFLWVVGKDPTLFDYFLPEKWRKTPRTKLSVWCPVYETTTKDNVHLVWRVSRVGERPDMDPFSPKEKRILSYGYNSPFEEVAFSMALMRSGIDATYPRAIYMGGHTSDITPRLLDKSRYDSHRPLTTPTGHPILSMHHDYVIIWGYWNGPDELIAAHDQDYCKGIDALQAYREGRLSEATYTNVMRTTRQRMLQAGIEDLNLRGSHKLLSLTKDGKLVTDENRLPIVRICNFELLKCVTPKRSSPTGRALHAR